MGNVVNWLAAFRLYLDHSETILKRMYGGESQQWISFKQACSDAYDSLVGYRFVYKFRNYVQHCGLPIDTFRVSAATPDRVADGQRLVAILLQRKQLLSNYREWGPVKADLRGFEEEFALDDLFEQAMEGVRRIEEVRIVSAVQVAAAEIYRLRQALERVEDVPEGSHVHLFESRHASEGGSIEVTPVAIPVAAVEMLEAVAEGSADASSFIVRPTAPELPLDPTNVQEKFHAESRGVQAVSLMLEEGSATGAYHQEINRIITEDGSIEPLLTGLVNVSTVLAYAAAAATGASAQGFLAGLLNEYPKFGGSAPAPKVED
jgi:hypothetical protein